MRILLVDDEPQILSLLGQYLGRCGHEAILTGTCAAASAALEEGLEIDAAVIDLALPDGSGEDIARAVLALDSGIITVIATGYGYDPPRELTGKILVLPKPFLPRALVNLLARANLD